MQILLKDRGSALVIVLWLVMIMTVVATVTARMTLLDGRVSQLAVERIRCRWAARAGVETARALLLADERLSDVKMDLWSQNEAELVEVPLAGCKFTARVTDEASKLDINRIADTQLACLPDMKEDILNSILDWRDSDDEGRAEGAEMGYYLTLSNGYYCRNGSLGTIRELLRIKGITEDLFYGPQSQSEAWSENEGWIYYLTCHSAAPNIDGQGNARVNVNQADREELMNTLGLSREESQWIMNNRPFQTLASLTQAANTASTGTSGTGGSASGSSSTRSGGSSAGGSTSGGTAGGGGNTGGSSGSGSGNTGGSSGGGSGNTGAGRDAGSSGGSAGGGRSGSGSGGGSSSTPSGGSGSSRGSGTSGGGSSSGGNSSAGGTGGRASGSSSGSRSSSPQSGTPPSWKTVLSKEDQIAFDAQPFAQGRVNINTAGVIVLEALLQGNRQLAENIIAYRDGLDSGFENLEQVGQVEGMTEEILKGIIDQLTVRSSVFQIRSTAVSDATGQTYVVEVILNRDDLNGRILYWREQ
jgi:type II secretory pathway component PulK